jgi:two-component system, chemotaxis family, protein-glutamate methylesterase/glutaminase
VEKKPVNVLIVEDSPVERLLLSHILRAEGGFGVELAEDAERGLARLESFRPDVVLMDVHLPGMDGFEATRRIMETRPLPIVICSAATNSADMALTFQALEAGALSFVAKPAGPGHPQFGASVRNLVETLRLMSEVPVVRRHGRPARAAAPPRPARVGAADGARLVAIGASTGGPPVLHKILAGLPPGFPLPVLVVQHIAAGFLGGLRDWLARVTSLPVSIAAGGEALRGGAVYLAPDDRHLGVAESGHIALSQAPPESGLRPSVSYLFRSAAQAYGAGAVGVLLTGMGRDGAEELKLLRDRGAVTIAQDAESSVVHGMPGRAIELGAALHVLPPEQIAATLAALANRK